MLASTYDALCRVAMGLPLNGGDDAALKAAGLIFTETKTYLTAEGKALVNAAEDANKPATKISPDELRALLKAYPDIWSRHGILIGREDLDRLSDWRSDGYVEVAGVVLVTEWGDTREATRLPQSEMRARLTKAAFAVCEDHHGSIDGTMREQRTAA